MPPIDPPGEALTRASHDPFRGAQAVASGRTTRDRLRGPDFRRLRTDEIAERFGVPITTPLRTAFDLARRGPLVEAVAAVDALAFPCVVTDLPAPVPQHRVFLPDGRWKDLDLAWPTVPPGRRRLGLEYDGDEHRTIAGQNGDRIRDGELDDVGWETIRVSSVMVHDPGASAALVARVRRRIT